ncbi:MAG: hypothetical protein HRT87_08285 [Legionellales bacterium]|nr:hypothetical protein [Legionellales bacterium]
MISKYLINLIFVLITILQCSCQFYLNEPDYQISKIDLKNIHSPMNSYVANSIKKEFQKNNIDFNDTSSYVLKINQELFSYDIISTSSESYVREYKITLLIKYSLVTTDNKVKFTNKDSTSTIVFLDNANVNNYSNDLDQYKIKLSEKNAKQIIHQLAKYLSNKNENIL